LARNASRPVPGNPEDELLDRLAVSPALAGPELTFLRARIAERRGDVAQAATLVTECLKELPGHQGYLDFAVEVSAELLRAPASCYPSAPGSWVMPPNAAGPRTSASMPKEPP
jgi:hypothetical protein